MNLLVIPPNYLIYCIPLGIEKFYGSNIRLNNKLTYLNSTSCFYYNLRNGSFIYSNKVNNTLDL
jgi:hypothetical protein